MIKNIKSCNDYYNFGYLCKEVKETNPTLEKGVSYSNSGRRTPFFELWCTICRRTTASVSPLLYCWVTLLSCLFTFYPFLALQIIKKYVGRRMTLLKRKQIYKAVIRHDGI